MDFIWPAVLLAVSGLVLYYGIALMATYLRGLFVVVFLLPVNALFVFQREFRAWYYEHFVSRPLYHKKRVQRASEQVKRIAASGPTSRMVTARPGWHTMSQRFSEFKKDCEKVDLNDFRDVISIEVAKDGKSAVVVTEPLVNVSQMSKYLAAHGFALAVLPELDELTIGGLLMGFGVESTSHKFGLFQDIIVAAEVLLADGRVVIATRNNEYSDLFFALPWSHGTLGFIMSLSIKVVPAKKFIRLEYFPVSLDGMVTRMKEASTAANGPHFVEGLMFSGNKGVIMTGEMSDDINAGEYEPLGRWYKPWFYTHVRAIMEGPKVKFDETKPVKVEVIPLRDYYHRHTKSLFWEMSDVIPFGNAPWYRWIFGLVPPPQIAMLKLTQTKQIAKLFQEHFIFQDMLVPLQKLKETIVYFEDNYTVYPMWLCPHRVYSTPYGGFIHPVNNVKATGAAAKEPKDVANCDTNLPWEMFVDVGVYGRPTKPYNHFEGMPHMENKVIELQGFQALYARCYMNETEFRKMFDHELWDSMRKKYKAESRFPSIYEKISDNTLRGEIAEYRKGKGKKKD